MIPFKNLRELILLIESGVDENVVGKVLKINPKKIKKLYKKAKTLMPIISMDEEEGTSSGSPGTAAPAQPTVTKWESGLTRGRANPIDQNHKWESGINRGRANRLA